MSDRPTTPDFLVTALPEAHTWSDGPTPEALAKLPNCPAVYLLTDGSTAPVQLATTQALRRLLLARLTAPQTTRTAKADLAAIVRGVRWRPLATPFEGRWWYYRLARELYPKDYLRLIGFGPAWFLLVDWDQPVPELRVTDRVWCLPGQFVGPWATHAAGQEALAGLWDLFDLCRYSAQVRQAPHGTRCAYADMGRCDAPCDGSVPLAPYVARCRAAWRFATGGVVEWITVTTQRMAAASARLEYERAGQISQQLRFARTWQSQWSPRLRHADEFNRLLLLPATRRKAWKLLLFRAGHLADGPVVAERRLAAGAANWLRGELPRPPEALPSILQMEQTWLVCHLLWSRESETLISIALPNADMPTGFEAVVAERLAAVQSSRAPADGTESPSPDDTVPAPLNPPHD